MDATDHQPTATFLLLCAKNPILDKIKQCHTLFWYVPSMYGLKAKRLDYIIESPPDV